MNRFWIIWVALLVGACAETPPHTVFFGSQDGGTGGAAGNGAGGGAGSGGPCTVGQIRCNDGYEEVCGEGALWILTNSRGNCRVDPCVEAERKRSYIGCEYWPVDLDNAVEVDVRTPPPTGCLTSTNNPDFQLRNDMEVCVNNGGLAGLCDPGGQCPEGFQCRVAPACVLDAQGSPFSVVVSNPSDTDPATVTLLGPSGHAHSQELAPNAIAKLFPGQLGFPDASVDRSSQEARAYKLTSTAPIVAYQFNPLDNVGVFSNDGSLLIPQHALDTIYYVMTLPTLERRPRKNDYSGYVAIVATSPNPTTIRLTPKTSVRQGTNIGRLDPDVPHEFTLAQGEVLNLEAEAGGDLTGTRIESVDGVTTFAVFVGHEATVLSDRPPQQGLCCADHIEEQLFPASTWGSRFVIARTEPRPDRNRGGGSAPDMLRILAQKPETSVEFNPPVSGNCPVLGVGEFCDVFLSGDTTINASKPILVGHFLLSTDSLSGDPAMAFAAPTEQFREAYTFLVPDEYDVQYISVAAWSTGAILLDGQDQSGRLTPISNNWVGGRIPVQPGQHVLTCPNKCGLLVYGYSRAVSYLFAGGLDLEAITIP